jgi:tripartite-type tricarboxylate transporter receptor subunit TctC
VLVALPSGIVSIYLSGIPPAISHVISGKLVALGVASTKSVSSLPNVPPLAIGALHGLEQEIVAILHARIHQVLETLAIHSD